MTQSPESDKERLLQSGQRSAFLADLSPHEFLPVYAQEDADGHHVGKFCALIPTALIEKSLSRPSWDLTIGCGRPGTVHYLGDKNRVEYFRYGDEDGIEPLILRREFHSLREPYIEINEEFRLFHNLFHDRKSDRYYKFDDAGNEELVAVVEPCKVKIRLLEIRQFCAVREMHLALFFDSTAFSAHHLAHLGLSEGGGEEREELFVLSFYKGNYPGPSKQRAFSRLFGKRLIPPLPKEKSGFGDFAEPEAERVVEFIIGVEDDGSVRVSTSSEAELSNYFGANPGKPHYLTPVFFRKAVLDKYYQHTSKYSIGSSQLSCAGLWTMSLDNHLDDHVVAWLGDLGRDLPYQERLHWQSFNVPPVGTMSQTFFRQQILAEWVGTDHPEHLFKVEYGELLSRAEKLIGWSILLPLTKEDQHYLQALRIPATNEQRDFDEVILALAKILIESLNERGLNGLIEAADRESLKGSISRLQCACEKRGVPDYTEHIQFLRDLQDLRSSGAAHRKGSSYQKIAEKVGINAQSLREVFKGLLIKGLKLVRFLRETVESGAFQTH